MDLDEIKDARESKDTEDEAPDVTAFKMDGQTLYDLKDEVNATTNQEAAPLVEALIHEFLGNFDKAEEKKQEFLDRE